MATFIMRSGLAPFARRGAFGSTVRITRTGANRSERCTESTSWGHWFEPSTAHFSCCFHNVLWRQSAGEGVEAPLVRDSFQFVVASVFELKAGAGHEIFDGARDEHLACARK
jgi:hypothetical protein